MRQLGGCGGEFAVAVAWTQFTSVGQEYLRLDNAFVAGAGTRVRLDHVASFIVNANHGIV